MFKRSELRHACYRAKNNAVTEKNRILLDVIEPMLERWQNWKNFATEWDILVDPTGKIHIVKPETDYDFIHSTLLEASICAKNNIPFNFDDRKQNIVEQTEILMLEKVMTWENYNTVWGIFVDTQINAFRTRLYAKPSQKAVTDEMISASTGKADGSAFTELTPSTIELKPTPVDMISKVKAAIDEATRARKK